MRPRALQLLFLAILFGLALMIALPGETSDRDLEQRAIEALIVATGGNPSPAPADTELSRRVANVLLAGLDPDPDGLVVTVNDGVVTLRGDAVSPEWTQRASELAESVPGVLWVENLLGVGGPSGVTHVVAAPYDGSTAIDFLTADGRLAGRAIQVAVSDRTATISGLVNNRQAQALVYNAVQRVHGLRSIRDELSVLAPFVLDSKRIDENGLAFIIAQRLEYHEAREMRARRLLFGEPIERPRAFEDVTIRVREGVAILTGSVASEDLRTTAESIALGTGGILAVDSRLRVQP